ncbi:hypothetical protein ACUKBL_00220 (plasmid) [Furfurilactobacillus rossiae]|uniref:hypothetical protein n=1 Tax=Furfurilactobacillus rossiae TaxID=231049 RepID=UPI001F3DC0A2|nr:hypothetical protein [Furfurilactobacillus rossiae]MCF6164793.1 hypothetical protein [Furfurilactobacillus rossiae]
MEANAVKVRFFRKEYGRISRGLSDHKFLYFLPSNVKDRHELHVGSVIAVNNHYGVVEAAVIVEFLYSNHVDDFKQVLGNYHADYYGEMEDGDEQ